MLLETNGQSKTFTQHTVKEVAMKKEKLKEIVEEKIDEAFAEYFNDMNIQTGDIYPLQGIELDNLEDEIVDFILKIAKQNM